MLEISNFNELERVISCDNFALILFGSNDCNPCISLKNKIQKAGFNKELHTYYVDLNKDKTLAAKLEIYTAPTLILFIGGKVALKEAGIFSLDLLIPKINRYANML